MKLITKQKGSITLTTEAIIMVAMVVIAVVAYQISQKTSEEREKGSDSTKWLECESVLECEQNEKEKKPVSQN